MKCLFVCRNDPVTGLLVPSLDRYGCGTPGELPFCKHSDLSTNVLLLLTATLDKMFTCGVKYKLQTGSELTGGIEHRTFAEFMSTCDVDFVVSSRRRAPAAHLKSVFYLHPSSN